MKPAILIKAVLRQGLGPRRGDQVLVKSGFPLRGRELHLNTVKISPEGQSGNQAVLNRQNEMMKTPCLLFSFESRLPKLDVAGSIPVSRSIVSIGLQASPKIVYLD
jgi:hypothetical protein